MKTLKTFAAGLALIVLTGCASMTAQDGATEAALCQLWGESLPTRSHIDTQKTQDEIQVSYVDFANACPEWAHLVP